MASIDFEALSTRFEIDLSTMSDLEISMEHVAASYGSLAGTVQVISDITRQPAFILPGATREIYMSSVALDRLRRKDESDEDDSETEYAVSGTGGAGNRRMRCPSRARSTHGSPAHIWVLGTLFLARMSTGQGIF